MEPQIMETVATSEEIAYCLDKITVEIQFQILKKGHVYEESYVRKFKELLCMNTLDLAFGHKSKEKIKIQTTKNMARLLAAMIITAILETKTEYLNTEDKTLSWNECKKARIWTRYCVQSESQTIYRLDWFIYRLIISGPGSIKQWLKTTKTLTLKTIEYEIENESDLEYDHEELKEVTKKELETTSNRELKMKTKQGILYKLCSFFGCK